MASATFQPVGVVGDAIVLKDRLQAFFMEFADMEMEILESPIYQRDRLDRTRTLVQHCADEIKNLEEFIDATETDYDIDSAADRIVRSLRKAHGDLLRHEHDLRYIVEGKTSWDLPLSADLHTAHKSAGEDYTRMEVAFRVKWLHENFDRNHEDDLEDPRYGNFETHETLSLTSDDLPEHARFLLDDVQPRSVEWQLFLSLVSQLTAWERNIQAVLSSYLDDLFEDGKTPYSPVQLEEVSHIASADARATGNTECPICISGFTNHSTIDLGDVSCQPAMRTNACSHFFCAPCLSTWIENDQHEIPTCPNCRTPLAVRHKQWPPRVQAHIDWLREVMCDSRIADRHVDVFLLNMTKCDANDLHDASFSDLLHGMQLNVDFLQHWEDGFKLMLECS